MTNFSIDFSEIPTTEPVPEQWYPAEIVTVKAGVSKSSGSPKLDVQWKITGDEYNNRRVFQTLSLKPEALWALRAFMEGLGLVPKNFDGALDINAEEWIGMEGWIKVGIQKSEQINPETNEPYEPRNNVKKIALSAPDGAGDLDSLI